MRKKMLLLYNPSAGRAQASQHLDMLLHRFCAGGYEVTVWPIMEGCRTEDILREADGRGYAAVVCSGGDGTLHHVLNGLLRMRQPPVLGYIPAGSTNDFAVSLGLPKNAEDVADVILQGCEHTVDVGDFGGELFSYVAAFGAFSAVSYATPQELKNTLGHMAYIIEGIRNLPIGQKYPARVEACGRVFEDDLLFCSISNTTSIGGFSLEKSVDAQLDDGAFELLLIKAPASVAEGNAIIAKLLARDFENEFIHLLHTPSARFSFPAPTAWTLDGEFGGEHTAVEVRVRRRALRMLL